MGGTFIRLIAQGHDVHVAYQTSGNIAVLDDIVLQTLDTARECGFVDRYNEVQEIINNKKKGEAEPIELRRLKGSIRRAEARSRLPPNGTSTDRSHVDFLDLPFYETGGVKKGLLTDKDIQIVVDLLREIKPHQIYARPATSLIRTARTASASKPYWPPWKWYRTRSGSRSAACGSTAGHGRSGTSTWSTWPYR